MYKSYMYISVQALRNAVCVDKTVVHETLTGNRLHTHTEIPLQPTVVHTLSTFNAIQKEEISNTHSLRVYCDKGCPVYKGTWCNCSLQGPVGLKELRGWFISHFDLVTFTRPVGGNINLAPASEDIPQWAIY